VTEPILDGMPEPVLIVDDPAAARITDLYVRNEHGQFAQPWTGLPVLPSDDDLAFLADYLRRFGWVAGRPGTKIGNDRARFEVSPDHPDTSRAIVDKIRGGSLQHVMLTRFIGGGSYTDDELEVAMGRSHQSVSATRNTLVRKGFLTDSGERRTNRWGNEAIVWTWTRKEPQQ
jgi:hypothetical protein